jgi:hypothetical protein
LELAVVDDLPEVVELDEVTLVEVDEADAFDFDDDLLAMARPPMKAAATSTITPAMAATRFGVDHPPLG